MKISKSWQVWSHGLFKWFHAFVSLVYQKNWTDKNIQFISNARIRTYSCIKKRIQIKSLDSGIQSLQLKNVIKQYHLPKNFTNQVPFTTIPEWQTLLHSSHKLKSKNPHLFQQLEMPSCQISEAASRDQLYKISKIERRWGKGHRKCHNFRMVLTKCHKFSIDHLSTLISYDIHLSAITFQPITLVS